MKILTRPYSSDQDLQRIQNFLTEARAAVGNWGYLHPGDVLWRIFRSPDADPRSTTHLWEDGRGSLLGFALFYPPNAVDIQIGPALRGSGLLEHQMLDWAESQARQFPPAGPEQPALITDAFTDDTRRIALLTERGFRPSGTSYCYMVRDMDQPVLSPDLPAGFSIASMAGGADTDKWLSVQWARGSTITAEACHKLRLAPGYDFDLDLVAVAPDRSFAACCLCWLDPANKVGLLEPVGTREAHRRRGLGKALVCEGLNRLKKLGAVQTLVYPTSDNQAAVNLYQSAGFATTHRFADYARPH